MTTPRKASRREWIGLAVIAVPCVVYSMDMTVLNLAVPAISEQLRPSNSQLLCMVDIYGFLVAGFLITMGTLGDRIGRRRLLLIGAAAFAAASAVAAFADSAGLAPVFTIGNEMIITAAPPERAGAASAIAETSAELSGALGIAVLGSLGMLLYRHALAADLPDGMGEPAVRGALATLGGAMAVASALPPEPAEPMRMAARDAFVDALRFTAAAGAAIVALSSVLAARILRGAAVHPPAAREEKSPSRDSWRTP